MIADCVVVSVPDGRCATVAELFGLEDGSR